jgi:YbbR domain-containing protein
MKIALQYVSDISGTPQAVQIPISDWEKVLLKLKKYEQAFKIKADLKEAYSDVDKLKKSLQKKQTLTEFLNEL